VFTATVLGAPPGHVSNMTRNYSIRM
jgi:hypothetical protein